MQEQQNKLYGSTMAGKNDKNMTDRSQNLDTLTVNVFGGKRRS